MIKDPKIGEKSVFFAAKLGNMGFFVGNLCWFEFWKTSWIIVTLPQFGSRTFKVGYFLERFGQIISWKIYWWVEDTNRQQLSLAKQGSFRLRKTVVSVNIHWYARILIETYPPKWYEDSSPKSCISGNITEIEEFSRFFLDTVYHDWCVDDIYTCIYITNIRYNTSKYRYAHRIVTPLYPPTNLTTPVLQVGFTAHFFLPSTW